MTTEQKAFETELKKGEKGPIDRETIEKLLASGADPTKKISFHKDALHYVLHHGGGLQVIGSDKHRLGPKNAWLIEVLLGSGCKVQWEHFDALHVRNKSEKTIDGVEIVDMLIDTAMAKKVLDMNPDRKAEGRGEKVIQWFMKAEPIWLEKLVAKGVWQKEEVDRLKEELLRDEEAKVAAAAAYAAARRTFFHANYYREDNVIDLNEKTEIVLNEDGTVVINDDDPGNDDRSDACFFGGYTQYTGTWQQSSGQLIVDGKWVGDIQQLSGEIVIVVKSKRVTSQRGGGPKISDSNYTVQVSIGSGTAQIIEGLKTIFTTLDNKTGNEKRG